jgi:hypothetical protein
MARVHADSAVFHTVLAIDVTAAQTTGYAFN